MEAIQYHLFGQGLCGRGIRVRELDAIEVEENARLAMGMVSESDSMMALTQIETREGIKLMLMAVTKRDHLSPKELMELRDTDWEPLSLLKLKMPDSPWHYETLFGRSKDHAALARIWRRIHVPDQKDIDAIVEKGCPVASEAAPPNTGSATGKAG